MARTIGVILSGGRSRRMGRDKGGLRLGGRTLLERMTAELSPLFAELYVSVDKPGRCPGCRELADLRPGHGPLGGLETAFRLTGAEAVFLAAVDLPFASQALARRVLEEAEGHDACVIRRQAGGIQPLFALYRRSCLPAVSACLDQGRLAMKALLDGTDCRWLEESELPRFDLDLALRNINTWQDYRRAVRQWDEKFFFTTVL